MEDIKNKIMENRIIKLRAWDGEKMIYRGLHDRNWYTYEKGGKLVQGTHPDDARQLKTMELTPFKDSEGKEIYEGDLIGDWTEVDGEMTKSRLTVYFDEMLGQWMLDNSLRQDRSLSYSLFHELQEFKYKVVGNIYQK